MTSDRSGDYYLTRFKFSQNLSHTTIITTQEVLCPGKGSGTHLKGALLHGMPSLLFYSGNCIPVTNDF